MFDFSDGNFLELNPIFSHYHSRGDFNPSPEWLLSSDGFGFSVSCSLRYYALLYSKDGLAREEGDHIKRREYCLIESGLSDGKEALLPWVEHLVEGELIFFRNMINSCLVFQFDDLLSDALVINEACERLKMDVRVNPDVSTMKNLISFQGRLRELTEEMNGEPLERSRVSDLKSLMFQKSLGIKPEEYILNFEKFGKPFLV